MIQLLLALPDSTKHCTNCRVKTTDLRFSQIYEHFMPAVYIGHTYNIGPSQCIILSNWLILSFDDRIVMFSIVLDKT